MKSAESPAAAPRTRPATRELPLLDGRRRAKSRAPATAPATRKMPIAMVCSAAFAAASVLVTPRARIAVTIESIPKVTRRPGSIRVIQSKRSNGTNGSPKSRSARKNRAMSGAVKSAPASAPVAAPGFSMSRCSLLKSCRAAVLLYTMSGGMAARNCPAGTYSSFVRKALRR